MNSLFLFFIFFVLGCITQLICNFLLTINRYTKNKILKNIISFFYVCLLCLCFQIFVTKLNFGEFRAFFTFSYILGIFFVYIINRYMLEKFFLSLYNKIIKEKKKCKEIEK